MFEGGGYDVNPGRSQQNYGVVGVAVAWQVSERLNLGVEAYHQTPALAGGSSLTNLGFGAIYPLTEHWAVMASGGPGLQTPTRSGLSAFLPKPPVHKLSRSASTIALLIFVIRRRTSAFVTA